MGHFIFIFFLLVLGDKKNGKNNGGERKMIGLLDFILPFGEGGYGWVE